MTQIIEKEIKVLNIKKKKLIKKLEKMGATLVFDGIIEDTYYDTASKSLAKANKRVRVRKSNDTTYITMKENLRASKIKACYENEIEIGCTEDAHHLLTQQGLSPSWKKVKERIAYTYKGVHFDIDIYADIPPMLEIEAEDEATIYKWVKKLGLKKKTLATFGAHGLFKYYNMQHKLVHFS